jgi:hypothetical protein
MDFSMVDSFHVQRNLRKHIQENKNTNQIDMIRKKKERTGPIVIDLTGPDGNAYALMAYATRFAKQLDLDEKVIIKEMTSGDYENLLKVFDRYFGGFVILER